MTHRHVRPDVCVCTWPRNGRAFGGGGGSRTALAPCCRGDCCSLNLITEMSRGVLEGGDLRSTAITITPGGTANGGTFLADPHTARQSHIIHQHGATSGFEMCFGWDPQHPTKTRLKSTIKKFLNHVLLMILFSGRQHLPADSGTWCGTMWYKVVQCGTAWYRCLATLGSGLNTCIRHLYCVVQWR